MNIVKRELKANLKSMIIWSSSMAFLVTVWLMEYSSFAENPAINDFMASMPQGVLTALGMQDFSLSSLNGFIGSISLYFYLLLGIQAVLLGSNIISKEERDKTCEYLFTFPISRKKVLRSKAFSALINLAILNIITFIFLILSTMNYKKEENFYQFIGIMLVSVFIVQLIFLSIGMFVSSVNKKHKKSGNISVGILMVTFLISSLINMVDSVDFLKIITPFKYFDTAYILNEMSLEPIYILISFLIIIAGMGGTFIFYPKRDLYI